MNKDQLREGAFEQFYLEAKGKSIIITKGEAAAFKFGLEKGEQFESERDKWIECNHKTILPEGRYNLLIECNGRQTVSYFRAFKGGSEIRYFYCIAYNVIPELPEPKTSKKIS